MPDAAYVRAPGVVWRTAPDRVLVRRIGDRSTNGQADLIGLGALIWLVLDRPCTTADIAHELTAAEIDAAGDDIANAVRTLVDGRWLIESAIA